MFRSLSFLVASQSGAILSYLGNDWHKSHFRSASVIAMVSSCSFGFFPEELAVQVPVWRTLYDQVFVVWHLSSCAVLRQVLSFILFLGLRLGFHQNPFPEVSKNRNGSASRDGGFLYAEVKTDPTGPSCQKTVLQRPELHQSAEGEDFIFK
ncbi:hypothetical protein Tco_0903602 [Tanacetum coccineum]